MSNLNNAFKRQAATSVLLLDTTGTLWSTVVRPRFAIIDVSRQAVYLVPLDFPRILFLNGCWGHAFWELPPVTAAQLAHMFENGADFLICPIAPIKVQHSANQGAA